MSEVETALSTSSGAQGASKLRCTSGGSNRKKARLEEDEKVLYMSEALFFALTLPLQEFSELSPWTGKITMRNCILSIDSKMGSLRLLVLIV